MRWLRNKRLRRTVAIVLLVALLVMATPDVAMARTPRWIQRLGHIAGHIVNAPARVATWSTKWMGPVLGPIAAMWLAGRITANSDIARIVKHAGNAQRAAQDLKLLSDSAESLRQVYRSEAEANRKLSQQMATLEAELKADGIQQGDLRRVIDLRRMQQAYEQMAERLDRRAETIGTKDVLDLFSRNAVKRFLAGGQEVLMGQLSQEVQRLVNKDVLVVLNGRGLDPQSVLEGIVQHDAERMLAGTEHADDREFVDRFREALKDRLKKDAEFLRHNWRPEVARLIAEVERRLKAERAESPTSTATASGETSITEEQIGVNPEDVTEEILPGEGPEGEGGSAVKPGTPKDQQWVVWEASEVGYKPLLINTVADFEKPTAGTAFPGGGTSDDPIKKTIVGGPFASVDDAREWLAGQLTDYGYLSGIYAGDYVAQFRGETHNIRMLGFDPQENP